MKHIVGFSGGVDSQAAALWVLNRFPKEDIIILNSPAGGNEHPLTTEHIEWFSRSVHSVIVVKAEIRDMWIGRDQAEKHGFEPRAELTFDLMAKIKGRFPSRKAQFCTEKLKLLPIRRWLFENLGHSSDLPCARHYERYAGVRRDESPAREKTVGRCYDEFFNCMVNQPVFDWTKKMCFDYIQSHGQQINPLYTFGFGRVGCAPCINAKKSDILAWAQRFPAMIDKVRGWEREVGRTFFAPIVPGLEINWVDEVVEWAKTDRGGSQYNMFKILEERPACESAYGLCE